MIAISTQYRYTLQRGSKKHTCPNCNKKRLVRYWDATENKLLPEQYGRCDREANCSYHLNPYQDGFAKGEATNEGIQAYKAPTQTPTPKPVFMPTEILQSTLKPEGYEQNVFLQNLLERVAYPLEVADLERVVSMYYLGTVRKGYRKGAITFPFIDKKDNIRAIQVKQFDNTNHTTGTDFLHAMLSKHLSKNRKPLPEWLEAYQQQDRKVSCLFGEHLLSRYPHSPIALVEAPKTAVYGTLYYGFPEQPNNFLWLAVYNLSSLTFEKCKALHTRDVYLFPDLSKTGHAFELWSKRAKQLEELLPNTSFTVSDLLEQHATDAERTKGLDLADFLIKQDWRKFRAESQKQLDNNPKTIRKQSNNNWKTTGKQPINNREARKMEEIEPQKSSIEKAAIGVKGVKRASSKKTFFLQQEVNTAAIEAKQKAKKQLWEVEALEEFFNQVELPCTSIELSKGIIITRTASFILSHLAIVKANNGNLAYKPYFDRLEQLKILLDKSVKI